MQRETEESIFQIKQLEKSQFKSLTELLESQMPSTGSLRVFLRHSLAFESAEIYKFIFIFV